MSLPNFGVILPNVLFRSAQPMTGQDFAWAKSALGINCIVKLDDNSEFPNATESKLAGCLVIPMSIGVTQVTLEQIQTVASMINKKVAAGRKVLVHCLHGRDRTGFAIGGYEALYLKRPWAAIQKEMAAHGITGPYAVMDATGIALVKALAKGNK